jgi:hypothetical protein
VLARSENREARSLILEYSAIFFKEKKARDVSAFLIAELKECLGIVKRKPAPEKPKPARRELTVIEEQIYFNDRRERELRREFAMMEADPFYQPCWSYS